MSGSFKDRLYEQLARAGQALANGHRLELLDLLCQGERSVDELAKEARLSLQSASQHLQVLHQAHLIERRRAGTQVRYRVAGTEVAALWVSLRDLAAERLPEVARVVAADFGQPDPLEPVSQGELERRLLGGDILVIDVRPPLEYLAGHIPGAVSIPVDELEGRLGELPTGREIVAYCRGPYCLFSGEAVVRLRRAGMRARRLEQGFPEWSISGREVAVGVA